MTYREKTAKLAPARILSVLIVALLIAVGLLHLGHGYGDQLPNRSLTLDKGTVSATDTYKLSFTLPQAQNLGSIKLQFCQDGPLIGTPCSGPVGLDATGAVLSSQAGETGFSVSPLGDDHTVILARTISAGTTATTVTYEITGIVNPSSSGTFFARLQTFTSIDATGAETDEGGLAVNVLDAVSVSATVPPYLYFCLGVQISNTDCTTATGDQINFGDFTSVVASTAQTQMVAGTNGPTGYGITVNGTTLTSGINTIPALTVADVSRPGTSQFGMNLVANTDPTVGDNPNGGGSGQPTPGYNSPNLYKFVPGDIVASNPVPDLPRKYTASYIANINKNQEPGVYVSTLTYVATADF